MKISFSINIKELLNATVEIRRFIQGKKNKQVFVLKIKVTKARLILYGIGVEQVVKISNSKGTGFIYIPLELLHMIVESLREKELLFTFTQGEVAYSNAKSANSKIILSKEDLNKLQSSTITPKIIKESNSETTKKIENKRQNKIFITPDIFIHNSKDMDYVNNLFKNRYHRVLLLAIESLEIAKKQKIFNGDNETGFSKRFELIIDNNEFGIMRFVVNKKNELYFSKTRDKMELIYSEAFDYQLLLKKEIDLLGEKLRNCGKFLAELKGNEEVVLNVFEV